MFLFHPWEKVGRKTENPCPTEAILIYFFGLVTGPPFSEPPPQLHYFFLTLGNRRLIFLNTRK